MTDLNHGKTQQGKALLILDGHEFTKNPDTKSTTHWRCAKWRSHRFPMTLVTCNETIISFNHEQSHEFNPGRVEARQIVSQLNETAKSQINPVNNQLIAASLKTVNDNPAIQLSLSSRAALTRTLHGNKTQEPLRVISSTDRHLNIPDKYLPFRQHYSGREDSERFLISWDMGNLNALRVHSKVRLLDGTFKILRVSLNFISCTKYITRLATFIPPAFTFCLATKRSPLTTGFMKP